MQIYKNKKDMKVKKKIIPKSRSFWTQYDLLIVFYRYIHYSKFAGESQAVAAPKNKKEIVRY